jgi:radical SAM superfamily enzyme YgiQ (UPF0313 family)
VQELQELYDLGWRREIFVVDDNFIGNPGKAREALNAMIQWMEEHGRPFIFFTHSSINLSQLPELMDLMVRAEFTTVYVGIESTDKDALRIAGKAQNVAIDLDEACQRINGAGLQIMAGTMIGMDGESPARDKSIVEFAVRNNLPIVEIALLYAYPGTALWQRLKQENRLLYSEENDLLQSNNLRMNFVPTRPIEDIEREFLNIMAELYARSPFLDRAFNHFSNMRPAPIRTKLGFPEWGEIKTLSITLIRWGFWGNTRRKFWNVLMKAYLNLDVKRFFLFIRSCIALEHYIDLHREFSDMLKRDTSRRGT